MPDLPSSLALTSIADGSQIVASDHRNNYSAIQAAVNALRTALAGGSAGQFLKAVDADTLIFASVPGQPAFVTSLPGAPSDGDECIYEASAANKVYWHLKYKASVTKWVKIGGPPLSAEVLTSEARNNAAYGDLTTVGPSITAPLAGDYRLPHGCEMIVGGADNGGMQSPKIGAAAASDNDAVHVNAAGAIKNTTARSMVRTLAASDVVKLQYRSSDTAGSISYKNRFLEIDPVFVS
jgi:hypothetical protein